MIAHVVVHGEDRALRSASARERRHATTAVASGDDHGGGDSDKSDGGEGDECEHVTIPSVGTVKWKRIFLQ